jgi:hypothetical protein
VLNQVAEHRVQVLEDLDLPALLVLLCQVHNSK